jgi:SAM-dependent methyltransferase
MLTNAPSAFRDGSYWGPNDEQANEHLELAHALFTKTLNGKLYLSPISPAAKEVLDLGTGTGVWAIDFADEHPDCFVIGTDLSPIQPNWVPPNCKFEIDDFNDEWTFGEHRFDFIHLRTSHASVHDRTKLYAQCFRALKPGGYLEEVEYSPQFTSEDETVLSDTAIAQWNVMADDVASKLPDGELYIFRLMKGYIERAGFEDVHEEQFRWPLGTWPKDKVLKELGSWGRAHIDMGLENWVLRLLTNMGWTVEDILTMCAGVRKQMRTQGVHALHRMNIVYGRKPRV